MGGLLCSMCPGNPPLLGNKSGMPFRAGFATFLRPRQTQDPTVQEHSTPPMDVWKTLLMADKIVNY